MNPEHEKCVIIVDGEQPIGIIANTAAILGITMGKSKPDIVGSDVSDSEGCSHMGIIRFPVPVLKGSREVLKAIRERLSEPKYAELTAVDFSDLAQRCKTYDEFTHNMSDASGNELNYISIAVCGSSKLVSKLTGNLPLLR